MQEHLIGGKATIVEALEALNHLSGATMVLFAVDDSGRLLGSLTDGDVRRALLSGHSLSDPVSSICKTDCLRISSSDDGKSAPEAIAKARALGITLLPVVEGDRIVSLLDLNRQRGVVPVDAVLMAGGAGERLRPLTASVPKPLLPVGGKPIIEHNIDLLRSFGITNIKVAVNYLKEQIINHLADVKGISFIEEPHKMGTIGALSLLHANDNHNNNKKSIIVMNADLLTDINLEEMYLKHEETQAWMTMAVVPYSVAVPFAIVDHEGDRITGLSEKPTFNYDANAGIYLLRREAIAEIPAGEYFDATDLAEKLLALNRRLSLYPIGGRWLDIGSPSDYRRACE